MTTKTTHTPTLWTIIDETRMGVKGDVNVYYEIKDAHENHICMVEFGEFINTEFAKPAVDSMAHIVRCVNEREELENYISRCELILRELTLTDGQSNLLQAKAEACLALRPDSLRWDYNALARAREEG